MSAKNSRTKNLLLNVGIGYLAQIITLLLQFVNRKAFLANLPVEYLGISGLFANILSVLALAELGADSAFVYTLYKPLAENDTKHVYSLLRYFRRVYMWLTIAVYACGLALVPVLKFIVNFDNSVGITTKEYTVYYIIYLTNTAITYLAAHCTTLLRANQDERVIRIFTLMTTIAMQLVQLVALYLWKNFAVYLCVILITTCVNTFIIVWVTKRRYPACLKKQGLVEVDKEGINRKVISTFLYKIGAVLVNNVDNILISILVSTTAVGLYSNYYTVTSAVQGLIAIVSTSLLSGLGNLFTNHDLQQQKRVFNIQLLLYHLIGAVGGIGFGLLFNDFIGLWVGKEYCFDNIIAIVLAVNFYIINSTAPVWLIREANGMFERVKYLMFIRAGVNLLLSWVLGKYYGVFGILLATGISLIVTSVWYEPGIIFKSIFKVRAWFYWKQQIRYFATTLTALVISVFAVCVLPGGLGGFVLKGCAIVLIVPGCFCVVNWRTDAMTEARKFLHRIIKR